MDLASSAWSGLTLACAVALWVPALALVVVTRARWQVVAGYGAGLFGALLIRGATGLATTPSRAVAIIQAVLLGAGLLLALTSVVPALERRWRGPFATLGDRLAMSGLLIGTAVAWLWRPCHGSGLLAAASTASVDILGALLPLAYETTIVLLPAAAVTLLLARTSQRLLDPLERLGWVVVGALLLAVATRSVASIAPLATF